MASFSPKNILIDTHIFIWLLFEDYKLTPIARAAIEQAEQVSISVISLWELAIKFSAQKFPYAPDVLAEGLKMLAIVELPIRPSHLMTLPTIELPHKDPFDALLIAQAQSEQVYFLTADKTILQSNYQTIDASR